MDIQTIKEIFIIATRRYVRRQYRYFVLKRSKLSGPEVRHVVTKILDEKNIYYSLEYPTFEKHRISGAGRSHVLKKRVERLIVAVLVQSLYAI